MRILAMLRFTLVEAVRRGTMIFYLIVGCIMIGIFAIWMKRPPDDPTSIMLFGNRLPGEFNGASSAKFFLLMLFRQSTFWVIVLGTFGTVGLITSFLDKGIIELYLSKPFKRWELFLSRALGASAGVIANLMFCIIGLWFVFGLKLSFWDFRFLFAGLLVSYAFVCYFSLVSFIALWTRNSILSIAFGLFFSFTSIGLESRQIGLYSIWNNVVYHRFLDVLYYLTPQLDGMLSNAARFMGEMPLTPIQVPFSWLPYLCSLGSSILFFSLSAYYFSTRDF